MTVVPGFAAADPRSSRRRREARRLRGTPRRHHRRGSDRVQVGDEGPRARCGAAPRWRRQPRSGAGRHDERTIRDAAIDLVERGQQLDPLARRAVRGLRPSPWRRRSIPRRRTRGRARSHGARADDPDRGHPRAYSPAPVTTAARRLRLRPAPVAQWTERRTSNPRVGGSNPPGRIRIYAESRLGRRHSRAGGHQNGQREPGAGGDIDQLERGRIPVRRRSIVGAGVSVCGHHLRP